MIARTFKSIVSKGGILRLRGHSFFYRLLPPDPKLLDLGAHRCEFSRLFKSRFPMSSACAVEANPVLAEQAVNDGQSVKFAALCGRLNSDSCIELTISENPEASSIFPGVAEAFKAASTIKVPQIEFDAVVRESGFEQVSLVKMDVEGAELDALLLSGRDTLDKCDQISVEFHDLFVPEMKQAVNKVLKRMNSLGFKRLNANWPGNDDVLFIHKRFASPLFVVRVSLLQFMYVVRGMLFKLLPPKRSDDKRQPAE
jgi:FkbM family methyltransferase